MITKKCTVSGKIFEITTDDLNFYRKMEIISAEDYEKLKSREISDCVGLPTLCPEERQRRRLAWRNERTLYQRKCDLCEKSIISIYDKEAEFPVYCQDCWWSDKWDAKEFSRDFDFSRPFFEQFRELTAEVPRINLVTVNSENSNFCNYVGDCKNCYLCFGSYPAEDCLYGSPYGCRDCVDSLVLRNSELCYESIESDNCYGCAFIKNSKNCSNSMFLNNCIGCSDCFGCVNLRNKQYYFLNKKHSKEKYLEKLSNLNINKFSSHQNLRENFEKFIINYPTKYSTMNNCVDSIGDYLFDCKNVKNSFNAQKCEDSAFLYQTILLKSSQNVSFMEESELMYESIGAYLNYENKFCNTVGKSNFLEYSDFCFNSSSNLFGCIGLKHVKYCIFNKQYTKEAYFKLRDKMISHMKKTGEWGEFFPISLSPFAYNETVAQEYFPLTKEEAEKKGFSWKDKISRNFRPATIETIPDDIEDVDDSICNEILACENKECGKNYKIQKAELRFYRKINLPIPRKCPDCRHADRMKLRNPRTLFKRQCHNCDCEIQTTFAPERPEKVVCEKCYLETVN